jgi:hypothetical protein
MIEDFDEVLTRWDTMRVRIQNVLTALPSQMSERSNALESEMRDYAKFLQDHYVQMSRRDQATVMRLHTAIRARRTQGLSMGVSSELLDQLEEPISLIDLVALVGEPPELPKVVAPAPAETQPKKIGRKPRKKA